jgi:catechol 2,3-dioxygenase-like lactoylglutathione lyase family enzyme
MAVKRVVPIIRVTNIEKAVDFYCSMLGFVADFRYAASPDGPTYVGVSLDGSQIHLSTFAGDGLVGTATYCYVDDVDALFQRFRAAGLKTPGNPASPVEDGPVDQTWGMRELYVRDPDGNTLRFGSSIPTSSSI